MLDPQGRQYRVPRDPRLVPAKIIHLDGPKSGGTYYRVLACGALRRLF